MASLIDGDLEEIRFAARSRDEIIEAIQVQLLPKQSTQDRSTLFQKVLDVSIKAQAALFRMKKQGYLVEQDDFLPTNLITFCHHLNVNSNRAYQRLKSTKVAVKSCNSNESDSELANLTVVLTDDYLNQSKSNNT